LSALVAEGGHVEGNTIYILTRFMKTVKSEATAAAATKNIGNSTLHAPARARYLEGGAMSHTLNDLLNRSFDAHARQPALRMLQGSRGNLRYEPTTYGQLKLQRDCLAAGLHGIGLSRGQRVGIMTDRPLEPLLLFLACDLLGLSAVPLCAKSTTEVLTHYIDHSEMAVLVVDAGVRRQVEGVISAMQSPPRLVVIEGGPGDECLSWDHLNPDGGTPPKVEVGPDDESKVLYTSGSSGLPKGVVQSHANIVANVESVWNLISLSDSFRFFKSAPDYHAMGILNIYFPLAKGWVLDLARSPDRVLSDIRYSEPDGFLTVPLVLDKVYGGVRKEMAAGGLKGRLVGRSVAAKRNLARGRAGVADRLVHATVGKRVIGQIRQRLAARVGGRLKVLIVGSAKADPEALDFFHEVLDIATFEGYGVTECAPLIAANHLQGRRVGSVGRPLFEVRLVDADGDEVASGDPASGRYRASRDGRPGELWVSGSNVMKGYARDPEQTAMVLVQSGGKTWYRTGDLFTMDEDGFLTFRGRVGRQFKLSNGEFVNPELLERVFARVTLIEHVLVVGLPEADQPVVVVTVNAEEARLADIPGLPVDNEQALRVYPPLTERIRQLLLDEADNAGLPNHERPAIVVVLPESLSEESGTLTRGMRKTVPAAVLARHRDLIFAAAR
jgi:long-chain acyl-CoA synthetase